MPDWKETVNLPRTGFSMKANLQTAEPEALAAPLPPVIMPAKPVRRAWRFSV